VENVNSKVKDTVIPLPATETPMIMRNREMRKSTSGRRRSSLGLRGKRTSSLYNGLCPLPHQSIDTQDFYRHIDAEQSDPVRMRQLLLWCAQKSQSKTSKQAIQLNLPSKKNKPNDGISAIDYLVNNIGKMIMLMR
jgi:hypothetical protein